MLAYELDFLSEAQIDDSASVSGRIGPTAAYGTMGVYGNPQKEIPPSADFSGGWAPGAGGGVNGMTNRDILGKRSR